jgi:DNA-binding transcriptional LysR family regulator
MSNIPRRYRIPNLRQFEHFVAVAEEMSFSRAAQRLNMAQPPLTASIKALEEELGQRLINRGKRILNLTDAGIALLREARLTLAQAERAVWMIRNNAFDSHERLRISFVGLGGAYEIVPRSLRAFRAKHPNVELALTRGTTGQQLNWFQKGEADVGIMVGPVETRENLVANVLLEFELVAAVPDNHQLVSSVTQVSLAKLSEDAWIMFPPAEGPGLHARIIEACRDAKIQPFVAHYVADFDTLLGFVASGLGVSLVPIPIMVQKRQNVSFIPVTGPGTPIRYDLVVVRRQGTEMDERINDFVEMLCSQVPGA